MKPARLGCTLPLALALAAAPAAMPLAAPVAAQEAPCRGDSGPDAEAGWAAYAAGDVTAARARFEAALARCASDPYAQTGLGYVRLREGDVRGAVALWEEVLDAEPENVDAHTGLGLASWRLGDLPAVERHFRRVLALAPGHATALDYLQRLTDVEAAAVPDAADSAWAAGDTAAARVLYRARLAATPEDDVAELRLGLMQAWNGDRDGALERLDGLIGRQPGNLDARLARARVRAWSGDLPGARAEVLEVLRLRPDHPEAREALAHFQAWEGDVGEALADYGDLLAIAPSLDDAERRRAQALAWASELEASREAYEALLARDPDDLEARLGLAQTLAYARDFDAAIAEYDTALAAAPGDVRARVGRGRALGWAGRLVQAERSMRDAVETDERSAAAWAGLGQVYAWQGRPADALQALERAASLAPADAEIADQLRSVRQGFAPAVRTSVIYERDSDRNRMITSSLVATWHASARLELQARGFHRDLEQGIFPRSAQGLAVTTTYALRPGWRLTAGVGGSRTDGTGEPSLLELRAGIRTPDRHALGLALDFTSVGLNETAALAELGGRSSELLLSTRWRPAPGWRMDGSMGVGRFDGSEHNGRRSASLSLSRRLGPFSLGASFRGFSFEKDLDDGYFDPDFYGIGELTAYWLAMPGPWTLLVEVAPGLQQVRRDGDPESSIRSNARVAYRFAPGREISLSVGYASAGLVSFATGWTDYDYTAVILGSSWSF
ncbi:MAG TPA: tetratricopeptide repeat protein [Longimicrobiales bacterium]|nr:tetratricopeptide repeat protein [Longimicrobiales bacterium]